MLQCVAVRCSVLQCVAVWLHECVAMLLHAQCDVASRCRSRTLLCVAKYCSVLQCIAVHYSALWCCYMNVLQCCCMHSMTSRVDVTRAYCCSVLQRVAVCCSELQCAAVLLHECFAVLLQAQHDFVSGCAQSYRI